MKLLVKVQLEEVYKGKPYKSSVAIHFDGNLYHITQQNGAYQQLFKESELNYSVLDHIGNSDIARFAISKALSLKISDPW